MFARRSATLPPLVLDLTPEAWRRVTRARKVVDNVLVSRRPTRAADIGPDSTAVTPHTHTHTHTQRDKKTVYGINTGFGNFATTVIDDKDIEQLQYNLITSHAAGVGEPMSLERTLSLMVLRINTLAKGHSGIRPETLRHMIDAFNAKAAPLIPEQGSVGASGDLAPLAHLACG